MGVFNKVYLEFARPFWGRQHDFIAVHSDPAPLCYALVNLARFTGAPALLGLTSGSKAREIEALTDAQVIGRILAGARRNRGVAIPDPLAVRITRWGQDPYARGAYSFVPTGERSALRTALGAPVDSTLYFAGEATHLDDPASVHGAYWSGVRAAEEALVALGAAG
jgi:monoamine oxidase